MEHVSSVPRPAAGRLLVASAQAQRRRSDRAVLPYLAHDRRPSFSLRPDTFRKDEDATPPPAAGSGGGGGGGGGGGRGARASASVSAR